MEEIKNDSVDSMKYCVMKNLEQCTKNDLIDRLLTINDRLSKEREKRINYQSTLDNARKVLKEKIKHLEERQAQRFNHTYDWAIKAYKEDLELLGDDSK